MTSINTGYKASTTDSSSMDPYLAEIQAQIQEALGEIEELKASDDINWFDDGQLAQLNRIETMLKAEYAAISGGGLGGVGQGPGAGEDHLQRPSELEAEWNGTYDIDPSDPHGQDIINSDPKYGEFAGTVNMPNSGNPAAPTKIAFQMTDDMEAIHAESRGRDIVVTVRYENGDVRSWVIKEGTVRPEPIIISALGLNHGVTMDFSSVLRVSTGEYPGYPYGQRSGFYIHGTEHNDTIIGTQSDDAIVAYAGDDIINGMSGNDTIYGDEYYGVAGQQNEGYGGNDEINGGIGEDIIYGGGGAKDVSFKSDKGEAVAETESWVDNVADADDIPHPDDTGWIYSSSDWEVQSDIEDGTIVVENSTGKAGDLEISMPPGYNMAIAEMDGDGNLVIIFVGEQGKTFRVLVQDFFGSFTDDDVVRLSFVGGSENDIIDFSRVTTTSQCISITDPYTSDDIILGAQNAMLADGVDMEEMLESQKTSDGELNGYVDEGVFATHSDNYNPEDMSEADGLKAKVDNTDNVIDIYEDNITETDFDGVLNIKAPEGFDNGYITTVGSDIYLILVKRTESGKAETIVFRIDGALGLEYGDINVRHSILEDDDETFGSSLEIIPVSSDIDDYLLDSGDGQDIVFTQKGGNINEDAAEDVVEIEPEPYVEWTAPSTPPPASDPPDEDPPDEDPPDDED